MKKNFNNFNDLLILLEKEAIKQNESYKKDLKKRNDKTLDDKTLDDITKKVLLYEIEDSPQYLDVIDFLTWNFDNLSNEFKNKLIKFLNDEFCELFTGHWLHEFYIIRDSIMYNTELKYLYKELRLPFAYKDSDKYAKRIATIIRKNERWLLPRLSPYEGLKRFAVKAQDLLYSGLELHNQLYTVKRHKKQYLNKFIFDLIKIIVCDNYKNNIKDKSNFRITEKHKKQYLNELEFFRYLSTKTASETKIRHIGLRP